ncbi:hypothetical protein C5U62_22290 [Pseudomonas protegens]|uniref:Uncharacterized protein n=1 Tax=Pseudomonas protegens TaxID=380021 RepID=A0A2T6GGW4_9PSED|nr:hypothetical protein C5U62_22290 [Pseudomonas protegens]
MGAGLPAKAASELPMTSRSLRTMTVGYRPQIFLVIQEQQGGTEAAFDFFDRHALRADAFGVLAGQSGKAGCIG